MANYIDQNIICEAYINIDKPLDQLSKLEQDLIKQHLLEAAARYAGFFLATDIRTEVKAEAGSIKSKITIYGTLATLYAMPLLASDFTTATNNLWRDSRRLSTYLTLESMYQYKARDSNITHYENRGGVLGTLQKITSRLKQAENFAGEDEDLTRLIDNLDFVCKDINQLEENIKNPIDLAFIQKHLKELIAKVPRQPAHSEVGRKHKENKVEDYQKAKGNAETALDKWSAKVPKHE